MIKMSVTFKMHLLRTDVTAVKYAKHFILAGIGGCIKIFDPIKSTLLGSIEIFHGQKIHGIEEGPSNSVLVWGGKMISHFTLSKTDELSISKPAVWQHNDWILHAKWLEEEYVAIVTAHNEVSLWNWRTEKKLKTVTCEEKCIVYCALLVGTSWSELVVLVGTVFQEVVIWSVRDHHANMSQLVLQRLKGHKGVIFSIFFDPATRLISTTSDDRSVRVWSVAGDWPDAAIELRHTLFGHRARVWRSCVAPSGDAVLSAGEDSQLCLWSGAGQLLRRWNTHQSGRIWSIDFSQEHATIVTGGGDGGVSLWPLRSWCEVSLTPTPLLLPSHLVPRRIALATARLMVTITDSGCILCRSFDQWHEAHQDPRLAGYCLMELSPCKQFVAFGSIDGYVLVYNVDHKSLECSLSNILDIKVTDGKIFSLQWLGSDRILICGLNGKLEMRRLNQNSDSKYGFEKMYDFQLPPGKEQWVCDAVLCGKSLICGDRSGNILCYELKDENVAQEPIQTFRRLHGRMGVCSLRVLGEQIVSTGRDGTLRQFDWQEETLSLVATNKLPMLWAVSTVESSYGLLILGFCEVTFMVWSWQEQRTILEVECGGGHRSWDAILDEENVFHLAYVREKMVRSISCPLGKLVKPVLQHGFHTKEIGCMRLLHTSLDQHPVLVTASEDTMIRLTSVGEPDELFTLSILRSHISSVRTLAICPGDVPNQHLLFSAGGRAQMKVWQVSTRDVPPSSDGEQPVTCKELTSHMLREPSRRPWRVAAAQPAVDAETRYMDLCVKCGDDNTVKVVAGCSDGLLRLFSYKISTQTLHLELECSYHDHCILKVSQITLRPNTEVVLSMATDGLCAFWSLSPQPCGSTTSETKPIASLKLHQSGINSFDHIELESNMFLLATGGDDNAMVVTMLKLLVDPLRVETVAQKVITSSHAAQITGLSFVDNYLVSACIDQRIRVWSWTYCSNTKALSCSLLDEYCTTVSDVQGLQLWKCRNRTFVCVYGKGMEVINIDIGNEIRQHDINQERLHFTT